MTRVMLVGLQPEAVNYSDPASRARVQQRCQRISYSALAGSYEGDVASGWIWARIQAAQHPD